ncbi:hypothetical protein LWM68_41275 [Niabella sp. W65]|nr:hypothetical protein [Niabella sp. W65]MCH7368605.1 hypothetical protein [Niabella sp. W65]ULT44193.1 hypothetical protein KRR40_12980 [Niabella sp. I65]
MNDSLRAVQNLTLAHGANSQAVLREQAVYASLKDKFDSVISSSKKQIDAYGRLSDLGARLTRHAQNMAAKYGAFSDQAQNAATRAKRVNEELAKIDANSGRYGRNVGNYASGYNAISVNMSRIIGEMPNFAQSVKIGFQSITNNIQPLKESIDDFIRKNKDLAAQGNQLKAH